MKERAVEPHDMVDVVFDLGRLEGMAFELVWAEVTVREDVIVAGPGLMYVLRRQSRRERQERRDEEQRNKPGQQAHRRIMRQFPLPSSSRAALNPSASFSAGPVPQ